MARTLALTYPSHVSFAIVKERNDVRICLRRQEELAVELNESAKEIELANERDGNGA